MIVLYYTQTYFLDGALETLQSLKQISELHLLIEISPESKKSTVIDVPSLEGFNTIEKFKNVVSQQVWEKFASYFEGIVSVHFVVHKSNHAFSPLSFYVSRLVKKYINQLNPDIIHFDTVSVRAIGLTTLARNYKINITVHDPLPHSGESSWKTNFAKYLFYRKARHFLFYSAFAQYQFKKHYSYLKPNSNLIRFQPFSFMRSSITPSGLGKKYILFFGRMSPYKGIDILLDAIPKVLTQHPSSTFVLAGNTDNYTLDHQTLLDHKNSVIILPGYLSTSQLADLIENAIFIVCPYRDATQSGVLMTAFAFGKTVIATNVGAFPEYISNGVNGLLTEPNSIALAETICQALTDDYYKNLQQQVIASFSPLHDANNRTALLNSYSN